MYYRKVVIFYVVTMISLVLFVLSWGFVVDPYMFFHKNWFVDGVMYDNLRVQSYGLIKNKTFDGIILGTSMLENTSADEASEKLGGRFANLSLESASYWEKFSILNFAFRAKKIDRVIMSLDMKFEESEIKKVNISFEPLLYSRFPLLGIFKVYATSVAASCIFAHKNCFYRRFNLDRPHAWYMNPYHAHRFGGLQYWLQNKYDDQLQDVFRFLLFENAWNSENVAGYKEIIDKEILPLFEHKDTKFDLIIPPYFALWWAKNFDNFDALMQPYKYLIEKAAPYENVKIYWFYDEYFVFDIGFYKDLTHYHMSVNSWQLDMIRDGKHIINAENCNEKILLFKEMLQRFNAAYFFDVFRKNNVLFGR